MAVKKPSKKAAKPVKKVVAKSNNKAKPKAVAKSKVVKAKITKAVKSVVPTKKIAPITIDKINKAFSKNELFKAIASHTELGHKQIANVFDVFSNIIAAHLKKGSPEKFMLPGLFKIVIRNMPATPKREGINPFTKEPTTFAAKPARKKVKIVALRGLKDLCKK